MRIKIFRATGWIVLPILLLAAGILMTSLVGRPAQAQSRFACSAVTTIPQAECQALVALYDSTNGPSWRVEEWLQPADPCAWEGVSCEAGHVTRLELRGFGLTGTIPPEVAALTNLHCLNLNYNDLSGSIPPELGSLSQLTDLDLAANQLSDSIPPELGNLSNLQYLELSSNPLTGAIPPELGNLSSLQFFNVDHDQLSGNIPPELGALTNLQYLFLWYNQLSGSIPPELGSLSNLNYLHLAANQLSGSIPPELGNLSNLQSLELSSNELSGAIPPELGNLSSLQFLSLAHDQLSGSIPPELSNLSNLRILYLYDNQLSGSIPPELGNLSNLNYLYLDGNQLSGSIPPELGALSSLQNLWLSSNQLSGTIPPELGNLSSLYELSLSRNQLIGDIPSDIANLTNLLPDDSSFLTDFGYNLLTASDPPLIAFLATKDPDWADTQTVPPTSVQATIQSTTSALVTWTPIPYAADGGYYEISYATTSGGAYIVHGTTTDKAATGYFVDNLQPGTTYHFVVRTFTSPHGYQVCYPRPWGWGYFSCHQQNDLRSSYSQEVSISTPCNTPVGNNVSVDLGDDVSALFCVVTTAGNTSVIASNMPPADGAPGSFQIAGSYYDIAATAQYGAGLNITLPYDDAGLSLDQENQVVILHRVLVGGLWEWQDCTVGVDTDTNAVTGHVTSLSWFVVGLPTNRPPAISSVTGLIDPITITSAVQVSSVFIDPDQNDAHAATWDWGDGALTAGVVNETNHTIAGSHTYAAAGVYTLRLTATDHAGESATATYQYIVIYDPGGGFVTAGGWINSPAGAWAGHPSVAGKGHFEFNPKYKKNDASLTGKAQFKMDGLNFGSDLLEWLVVSDGRMYLRGRGRINGQGDFAFLIAAIDGKIYGGSDKFRIKIWDRATGSVVYDNQMNAPDDADPTTAIAGGSIVIHKE